MSLLNCKKCGRVMQNSDRLLCKRCCTDEQDSYSAVREYVYNHRGATILQASEATGVDSATILRYLKEDRLSLVDDRTILPRCKVCRTFIKVGDICNECETKESRKEIEPLNRATTSSFGRRRR